MDEPDQEQAPPIVAPVSTDLRTPCQRAFDKFDTSWCDVGGCDFPCQLLDVLTVLDCDLGCHL
jgi:hypothetical protein